MLPEFFKNPATDAACQYYSHFATCPHSFPLPEFICLSDLQAFTFQFRRNSSADVLITHEHHFRLLFIAEFLTP
jgi:hypothetical protein